MPILQGLMTKLKSYLGSGLIEANEYMGESEKKALKFLDFTHGVEIGAAVGMGAFKELAPGARLVTDGGFDLSRVDGMIGPVPLSAITYCDFAESDSVVKYRAFGGEYFAHQGGDKNAMRVDFLLYGRTKDIYMNYLRFLRLFSKSRVRGKALFHTDESYITDPLNHGGEALWTFEKIERKSGAMKKAKPKDFTYDQLKDELIRTGYLTEKQYVDHINPYTGHRINNVSDRLYLVFVVVKMQKNNDWDDFLDQAKRVGRDLTSSYFGTVPTKNVNPLSIQKIMFADDVMETTGQTLLTHGEKYYELQQMGYYTYHFHYPVIIRDWLFFNMWIETVQFTVDSRDGIDCIKGHLLLRKYMRPPRLRWSAGGFPVSSLIEQNDKAQQQYTETIDAADVEKVTARGQVSAHLTLTHKGTAKTTIKKSTVSVDKKVWIWEERRNPQHQIGELAYEIGRATLMFATRQNMSPLGTLAAVSDASTGEKTINVEVQV